MNYQVMICLFLLGCSGSGARQTADYRTVSQKADLSRLLVTESECLLGFIGAEKKRLWLHYHSAEKTSDLTYSVEGKSRVGNHIVPFRGVFVVEYFVQKEVEYSREYGSGWQDTTLYAGTISGTYRLSEDSTYTHSGTFEGKWELPVSVGHGGETRVGYTGPEDGLKLKGVWQSYKHENIRVANLGQYRIPEAGDLDDGDGVFLPHEKYASVGWGDYRTSSDPCERGWWE